MGTYSNWESQSNFYNDTSEIQKRVKFDIDSMSENLTMIQGAGNLVAKKSAIKEEKSKLEAFAKNLDGYEFKLEDGNKKGWFRKNETPMLTGTRVGKDGNPETFSMSYEEMDAARGYILGGTDADVIFKEIKANNTQQVGVKKAKEMEKFSNLSLINKLPRNKKGKLIDTEITRRRDGSLVKVNAIEKDLYENHPQGQEIVDSIAGLPKKDKGMQAQEVAAPQASFMQNLGNLSMGNQGDSGDKLKPGLMAAAGTAMGPAGQVALLAADWMYDSAQKAKGVRKEIGKVEEGIDVLANSQQKTIEEMSTASQTALTSTEKILEDLTINTSNDLAKIGQNIDGVKKRTKGLEVGATGTLLADNSEMISTGAERTKMDISSKLDKELKALGNSGRNEVESIGFEIADMEDKIDTLSGQDSMVEQMFGSNIGGKMEKWG